MCDDWYRKFFTAANDERLSSRLDISRHACRAVVVLRRDVESSTAEAGLRDAYPTEANKETIERKPGLF